MGSHYRPTSGHETSGHDSIPPLDFGEMTIEKDDGNPGRSLACTAIKAAPKLAMAPHNLKIARGIVHVGNARNQREAVQIQTAGNLDASHADPLVRLQSYGGVARFRPHYVAIPAILKVTGTFSKVM